MNFSIRIKLLLFLTVVFSLLPFALYRYERVMGIIPTEEEWFSAGGNHGPWWGELAGMTVGYPMLILAMITAIWGLFYAFKNRSLWSFFEVYSVVVFQLIIGFGQVASLIWLID